MKKPFLSVNRLIAAGLIFSASLMMVQPAQAFFDDDHEHGRRRGGFGFSVDVGKLLKPTQKTETPPATTTPLAPEFPEGQPPQEGEPPQEKTPEVSTPEVTTPENDVPGEQTPEEGLGEEPVAGAEEVAEVRCRCQGGRLLIVIGRVMEKNPDPTIKAAADWALAMDKKMEKTHLHVIAYHSPGKSSKPYFNWPYVPDSDSKTGWKKREDIRKEDNMDKTLPQDCCYFDEVMIMFHGSQGGVWDGILEYLPEITQYKPIRKVTLWSCKSSKKFFPKSDKMTGEKYEKICGLFKPKNCPCECNHAACNAFNADGQATQCPTSEDPVTLLTAGSFNGHATDLGFDPDNPDNPLFTPDGKMREITITADGTITAKMTGPGTHVFGPTTVQTKDLPQGEGEVFSETVHLKDSKIIEPKEPEKPYSGPKACESKDGCFLPVEGVAGAEQY